MTKIDHVTVVVPNHPVSMKQATILLENIGLELVEPDSQYAARNTAWEYRHFQDGNGFKVHVVIEGPDDPYTGDPGLSHFRAVVTQEKFEELTSDDNPFLERNSGSGRIWLRGPGNLRVEVVTTEGLMPNLRAKFGAERKPPLIVSDYRTPEESMEASLDRMDVHIVQGIGEPAHLRRHREILDRAMQIMVERDEHYHDSWKNYGWRGAIYNLRRKAERAWSILFDAEPSALAGEPNYDDVIDMINYAAMAVQCVDDNNRDGKHDWWKAG